MTKQGRMVGARKQELVDAVAEKAGITKANAQTAIKSVQDSLLDLLEQSGRIQLAKFGIFKMTRTKARQGRNPATGQPITIPAGYRIGFKVSKTWKEAMLARKLEQLKDKVKVHMPKPAPKAKVAAKAKGKKK